MALVRLTNTEGVAIVEEAKRVMGNQLNRLSLYGSRADLSKKGGDIDLLIELDGIIGDKFALVQNLRQGLCSRLGEQKFDILIVPKDPKLNSDRENTFLSVILESRKILWSADE